MFCSNSERSEEVCVFDVKNEVFVGVIGVKKGENALFDQGNHLVDLKPAAYKERG